MKSSLNYNDLAITRGDSFARKKVVAYNQLFLDSPSFHYAAIFYHTQLNQTGGK
jgi:hypothetical protein